VSKADAVIPQRFDQVTPFIDNVGIYNNSSELQERTTIKAMMNYTGKIYNLSSVRYS